MPVTYYKHKQIENVEYVNNLMRQDITLYQHVQYWLKNTTQKRHVRVCAQLHFNICMETRLKLDKEQWYENALKLVETSH